MVTTINKSNIATPEKPVTLETALHFCNMALSVIPVYSVKADGSCTCGKADCKEIGKHPIISWKPLQKKRLTDREIAMHWRRNPDCNVGIVTGEQSGIIIIDIDGEQGIKSLQECLGLALDQMPVTPMVRTPGGGYHLYYRYTSNTLIKTKAGVLPGVDIRAEGGIVVAPPSKHRNGGIYKWVEGRSIDDIPIADFDFSKLYSKSPSEATVPVSSKDDPPTKKQWFKEALAGVGEGQRNDTATRLAGRYAYIGLIRDETELLLGAWNQRNSPPMEEKELAATIKSIYDKEHPEQKMDRQELLETISTVIGITLNSVRKIRSDNSSSTNIEMVFDQGVCSITNNDLHNAAHLQREISAATGHVVKKLGKSTITSHEQLIQMILDAAEVVSLDESATENGETLTYIRRYIRYNHVCPEIVDGQDNPEHGAFRYNRVIWFDVHEMFTLLLSAHKPTWSSRNLAVRLERLKLEKRDFKGKQHYGITYEMAGWKENMEFEYDERQVNQGGSQFFDFDEHQSTPSSHN